MVSCNFRTSKVMGDDDGTCVVFLLNLIYEVVYFDARGRVKARCWLIIQHYFWL